MSEPKMIEISSLTRDESNIISLLYKRRFAIGSWDLYKLFLCCDGKTRDITMKLTDNKSVDKLIAQLRKHNIDVITFNTFRRILMGLKIIFLIEERDNPSGKSKKLYYMSISNKKNLKVD